ncbi:hypothetical protein D8S82_26080, partial [Mycobacterium hodleri]
MLHPPRRRRFRKALATAALAGLTAATVALPGSVAHADPVPAPEPVPA